MITTTTAIIFGVFAFIVNIGVIFYSYKVMKIASYVTLWKRSWIYFITAISLTVVNRLFDLVSMEGFTHHFPAAVVGVFLALFVYNITKVFKSITEINTESRFMMLLRNLPDGVIIYSEDSTIAYANQKSKEILGLSGTVLEGLYDIDLDHRLHYLREDGTPLPKEESPFNVVASTGQPFFGKILGLNHTQPTRWVLVNAYLAGNSKQVVVVFTDITNLKKAESACKASEELYRNAFMYSHDAIVITELSTGLIYSINKTFNKLTGYGEEVVGKTSFEINLWKHVVDREWFQKELIEKGHIRDMDTYFIHKDGEDIHGLLSASILVNSGGCVLTSVKMVTIKT